MDLSKFDTASKASEGVDMVLRNPVTGQELVDEETNQKVTIRVIGQDSKEFQQATHAITNKRLQRTLGRKKIKISAEELADDSLDLLVKCTRGWKGIVVDGAPLEFSPENARNLYTRFPWIAEQVDEFTSDRANFLGN